MNPHTEDILLDEVDQLVVANQVLRRQVELLNGKIFVLMTMFSEEHREVWNHLAGLVEMLPYDARAPFKIQRDTASAVEDETDVV
tara:strand:- start:896 stop:1150 length:255 start_codon:yes stop_codon:yes gene_type:complete